MEHLDSQKQFGVSYEKVIKPNDVSFHTGVYKQHYFRRSWHYHYEFELLLITQGHGKRLVGDHAEDFAVGDLVLIGGALPHAWISDPVYLLPDSTEFCESTYVQFRKDTFGLYFIDVPELKGVRKSLGLAERGLKVVGEQKVLLIEMFKRFPKLAPLEQLLELIRILDLISRSDYELLASEHYVRESIYQRSNRMLKIHEYLMENFMHDITIKACAEMANMTTSSFCRFFKNESNDTFSNYLNKIRIDFSKKLLANTDIAIKEIAYQCGYNSVPYFNKQFKKVVGDSPFPYRKMQKELVLNS